MSGYKNMEMCADIWAHDVISANCVDRGVATMMLVFPADTEFSHFGLERSALHAEACGGAIGPSDNPVSIG